MCPEAESVLSLVIGIERKEDQQNERVEKQIEVSTGNIILCHSIQNKSVCTALCTGRQDPIDTKCWCRDYPKRTESSTPIPSSTLFQYSHVISTFL
jgi:hypothetical protein